MIYNNLIYLLVVILLLSASNIPDTPQLPFAASVAIFFGKLVFYTTLGSLLFRPKKVTQASDYFGSEQKLSILAIFFLAIDVYLLDCRFYFAKLPLSAQLPALTHFVGIILFFCYLAILWALAKPSYEHIFGRRQSTLSFLAANLKVNFAIILPWILLTLLFDLLELAPFPIIKSLLASPWGEPLIFLLSFIILVVWLPSIIVRLWGCQPLPEGPSRNLIEQFCTQQNLKYNNIVLWPLFEGRMLTAGVMGLHSRYRYLLVTPALLETMTPEEILAVMAHEIGHVKRHHLQLYLLLFLGFGLMAQLSASPLIGMLINSDIFIKAVELSNQPPETILTFASTTTLLLILIVYFRFVFGFFMRNFERQADLFALDAMGEARPLINVFEKIAWLSGKIRDLPSWHHFGIGQRIDYLTESEADHRLVDRHHRKVYLSLLLYMTVLVGGAILIWQMPQAVVAEASKSKIIEAVLRQKIKAEPSKASWPQLLGDLHYSQDRLREAITNYELSLALEDENAETLNNLAWLLITAKDVEILNLPRALQLAKKAAGISNAVHIFDTLATAYWANGERQKAMAIEKELLGRAEKNRAFYRMQLERFSNTDFIPGRTFIAIDK